MRRPVSLTAILVLSFPGDDQTLQIDPLLLAEAGEVWSVVSGPDNPVWPGWDATSTPLLFYFPGIQDVLVNHPDPPEGFVPYRGPLVVPGWDIHVRDGETTFSIDGQNTSTLVAGVPTLVVADTISNQRPNLLMLMAREGREEIEFSTLATDPYDQLGMIAHEAFHVFQDSWDRQVGGSEGTLLEYPVLSVENNVGVALEATALEQALRATNEEDLWTAALRFLALRKDRRTHLPPSCVSYEDGTELNEGLAKYIEWRLNEALVGREHAPAMAWARGFHGYDDATPLRESLLAQMRGFLSGEHVVNDDPYGTAPVRFRLYYSGMGLAAMLDRLDETWKERVMQPGVTLTGLLEEALMPFPEDLARALGEAQGTLEYRQLVSAKTALAKEGKVATQEKLQAILEGPGTLLTVDHSALAGPPGLAFTPFGITVVDPARTIYTMVPIRARLPDGSQVNQTQARPLLQHTRDATLRFRLPVELSEKTLLQSLGLDSMPDGPLEDLEFELDGVKLELGRAELELREGELVVRVLAR